MLAASGLDAGLLVGRDDVAAPTGHDRTTLVCFQDADRPGSLYGIMGRFAARDINLTKLESRPTKKALGDYCFLIDFDGHLGDAVVADCLRDLHAELAGVKVSEVRAVLKSAGAQPVAPPDALGAASAATDAPPSAHQVAPDAADVTVGDAARPVGVGGTA